MRRNISVVIGIVLVLMLSACGGKKVDDATAEKYIDKAEEIIGLLNESNYEDVHAMFGSSMETGLPVEDMAELTPIIQEAGTFEEIDKSSIEEDDGHYVTVLVAKYSNENRIFTISFNKDEEVVGLYIR